MDELPPYIQKSRLDLPDLSLVRQLGVGGERAIARKHSKANLVEDERGHLQNETKIKTRVRYDLDIPEQSWVQPVVSKSGLSRKLHFFY